MMKEKETSYKALRVIEEIAAEIGCTTQKKITVDRKFFDDIYAFAHVGLGYNHQDWKRQLDERYKEINTRRKYDRELLEII